MRGTLSERAHAAVEEVQENPVRFADRVFFTFATVAAAWLAFLLVNQFLTAGWRHLWAFLPFWLIVTYLLLPRIHSLLTKVYVPDYFIGRSRTREGLLGDPVNVGFRGRQDRIHEAMLRAGWHRADEINLTSSRRMVVSTIMRRSYPDAPVSPLYLFGRRQRFTYQQEVEGNPAKRHHVRFWPCPKGWRLPGGHRANWLAAGTYDTAVGLNLFTLQVTHRIDADIDAERDHIVATLTAPEAGNDGLRVKHLKNFSTGYHARNGGGDAIRTDGDLPIVDVRALPPATPEILAAVEADHREAEQSRAVPLTVALGLFLMLLRVVAGAFSLNWVLHLARESIDDLWILAPMLDLGFSLEQGYVLVRGVIMGYLLAYLLLSYLVYRGRNWARMVTMAISAVSIIVYAVLWLTAAPESALSSNLIGSSLEILVLLAFSGETARRFTSGKNPENHPIDGV
ncbi:LssY C-terminal domain-containing protein [Occultella gossypii]|uniref:LssY C-terminal domain-containing protein n=1 Tax=Occultella gossypii TaxID=2800820 RepID=A0ABS7SFZ1_9MICO|nr:LssY C-terminal domain-containing protein [Occultella gossypii]MBZ2198684.1 LssY C-terminal domain-containing protein [Occultella gossypii]